MEPEGRDAASLADMLKYARRARDIAAGRTLDECLARPELHYALERVVEIIGEAASRVSRPFRQGHPEIPWDDIAGMRVILAHRYSSVRPDRVWQTAVEDVPALIAALEPLVPTPPDEGASA
jgi:uncharacterized protein with HEPN domain